MKYLFILLLLALGACSGPITKDSIRLDPAYSTIFNVDKPYQQVFDKLLKKSQSCYLDQPNSKQLTLVGNRDNGKKTANITLEYVYAMAEQDVILMLDIRAVEDRKTTVNVYASKKHDTTEANRFEKWLANSAEQSGCA